MNFNELYRKIAEMDKPKADLGVKSVIDQLLDGDLDMYDVYADPQGSAQEEVSLMIDRHLGELSQETGIDLKHDLQLALDQVLNQFESKFGHSSDKENSTHEMTEGSDENSTRKLVLDVLKDMLPHAQAGENVVDNIADELGDYYDQVIDSGDHKLKQVYAAIRELDSEDPREQVLVIKAAIDELTLNNSNIEELADEVIDRIGGNTSPESLNFHVNTLLKQKGMSADLADDIKDLVVSKLDVINLDRSVKREDQGDGNLANNAKPYHQVTHGDVIAGRLGNDEMGGKDDVEEDAGLSEASISPDLREKIYRLLDQQLPPAEIGRKLGSMMPFKPSAKEIEAEAVKIQQDLKLSGAERAERSGITKAPGTGSTLDTIRNRGSQIDRMERDILKNSIEESGCGMSVEGPSYSTPPQQDSVNMSVNMSGSGKGGIRDLLNILKDIDGKAGGNDDRFTHGKMTIIDEPADLSDIMDSAEEESFGNSPAGASGPHTFGVDKVLRTGNDMHKPEKRNFTAGNPEEIKVHLESLYQKYRKN